MAAPNPHLPSTQQPDREDAPSIPDLDFAQVVDVLAAAVTIRDRGDQIVYANRAALDDMGFATLAEMQSRLPRSIMADYIVLDELGRDLSMADIPSVRLLRGERADPLLIRTVQRCSGELKWKLLKATPLIGDSDEMVATVTIIEDVTEVKNAELRNGFLAKAGEMLASSLDYAQTLQNVAWSVVPQLADWCAVDLFDETGAREQVVVAHSNPERLELAERLREYEPGELDREQGIGKVLATGRSSSTTRSPTRRSCGPRVTRSTSRCCARWRCARCCSFRCARRCERSGS